MNVALTSLIRGELLNLEGVKRLSPVRRFTSLLTSETAPECLYFLDSGFVKIVRRGDDAKEVIVSIIGPGEVFAEHAIQRIPRPFTAEVIQDGVIYEIPRDIFSAFCHRHPEVWKLMWELAVGRQLELEQKVALLCLQDVEYRILYYLAQLAQAFGPPNSDQAEYSIPLSQSELASLIGATRETTSTTLNALARQGLLRLGRRLVIVSSLETVRAAAKARAAKAAAATPSSQ
jgi:CRP/FNR family transcriptional regulator